MLTMWLSKYWVHLAIVAAVAAVLSLGYMAANYFDQVGYDRRDKEVLEAMQLVRDTADKRTEDIQKTTDTLLKEKDAELKTINSRLLSALDKLRQRPERRSQPGVPSGSGTCDGASGSELSGPDAGFLEREAARGNELRAALAQCYAQYEKVRATINLK